MSCELGRNLIHCWDHLLMEYLEYLCGEAAHSSPFQGKTPSQGFFSAISISSGVSSLRRSGATPRMFEDQGKGFRYSRHSATNFKQACMIPAQFSCSVWATAGRHCRGTVSRGWVFAHLDGGHCVATAGRVLQGPSATCTGPGQPIQCRSVFRVGST